jgi:hypothetical protein
LLDALLTAPTVLVVCSSTSPRAAGSPLVEIAISPTP